MEGRPNRNKRNFSRSGGSSCKQGASAVAVDADILAAATSVTSRYVSFLQSSKATSAQSPPISTKDIFPDHQPVPCCSGRIFGLACCGRDGADAAVTVGDSDFIAILAASEAAVEEGVGETTEKEEYDRGVATEEASCAAAEQTIEGCFAEGELTLEEAGFALGREDSNSGSHKQEGNEEDKGAVGSVGRAMDVLRVLDEDADPQAAVCLGPANAWVVKPVGLSCGRGVEVVSSLRGLVSACQRLKWKAVVQKYVERPLLVQVSSWSNTLLALSLLKGLRTQRTPNFLWYCFFATGVSCDICGSLVDCLIDLFVSIDTRPILHLLYLHFTPHPTRRR